MLLNVARKRISVVADPEATHYPFKRAGIPTCVRMEDGMASFMAFLFGDEVGWG